MEVEVEGGAPETNTRESNRAIAAMTSPWIEKYRPESLSDIIAHQDIMGTCERQPTLCRLPPLTPQHCLDAPCLATREGAPQRRGLRVPAHRMTGPPRSEPIRGQ